MNPERFHELRRITTDRYLRVHRRAPMTAPDARPVRPKPQRGVQADKEAPSVSRAILEPLVRLGRECPWRGCRACRGYARCFGNIGPYLNGRETDDAGCAACVARNLYVGVMP